MCTTNKQEGLEELITKVTGASMNTTLITLPAFIIETDFLTNTGFGNGYVLLPPTHKYFKIHYDDIPVEVHGGLTFSQSVDDRLSSWGILKEYTGWWCVGFDTAHFSDSLDDWDKQAVINETLYLMNQLL